MRRISISREGERSLADCGEWLLFRSVLRFGIDALLHVRGNIRDRAGSYQWQGDTKVAEQPDLGQMSCAAASKTLVVVEPESTVLQSWLDRYE